MASAAVLSRPVGLMLLFGAQRSVVLWLLLAAALGLTFWETRERGYDRRLTIWWLTLVALVHVIGYLALRVVGLVGDRSGAGSKHGRRP